jgi:hypothetical protein
MSYLSLGTLRENGGSGQYGSEKNQGGRLGDGCSGDNADIIGRSAGGLTESYRLVRYGQCEGIAATEFQAHSTARVEGPDMTHNAIAGIEFRIEDNDAEDVRVASNPSENRLPGFQTNNEPLQFAVIERLAVPRLDELA